MFTYLFAGTAPVLPRCQQSAGNQQMVDCCSDLATSLELFMETFRQGKG